MNYCSLKDAWGSNDYISKQFKEYMSPHLLENDKKNEVPDGKNNEKNSNLLVLIQTILMPIKTVKLKQKVTIN